MPRFDPGFSVTGIGSLPHTDPEDAVSFVAECCPEVPFWPQLPGRGNEEGFLSQFLPDALSFLTPSTDNTSYQIVGSDVPAMLSRLRNAPIPGESSMSGFYSFLRGVLRGDFPEARAVKGQISGPVTLLRMLQVEGENGTSAEDLFEGIFEHIEKISRWQIEQLSQFGLPVLFSLDEPALAFDDNPRPKLERLNQFMERLRSLDARIGMHSCAQIPWDWLLELRPDFFSFNAHQGLDSFSRSREANRFLSGGGSACLGLVPTQERLDEVGLEEQVKKLEAWIRSHEHREHLGRSSLITATCGLASSTPSAARHSFQAATRISEELRNRFPVL